MKRFILVTLLFSATVQAQSRVETITRFSGLNNSAGILQRKSNEAIICNNIDLSRNGVGTFSKRYGYDSVSYLAGQDSCVGVGSIYPSDGRQFLGTVWDSTGVGYGGIYISPEGKDYFTGTTSWSIIPNVHNSYTYIDSFVFAGDTVVVSYLSDASATYEEIVNGLYDTISADTRLTGYLEWRGYPNPFGVADAEPQYVDEAIEFLSATMDSDTAQTLDTISNYTGKVWDYFSVQNPPWFAQFNDEWFVVNGAQKGVRWNGDVARSWPPNAPGEPSIIPLKTDGPLDGEYRYTFRHARTADTDSLGLAGYVSAPIRVKNGQVMLKDFWWPAADSGRAETDSVFLVGYRTKANPGLITEGDYAFFFDTIAVAATDSALAEVIYVDSISDDALSATDSVQLMHIDMIGRDTVGVRDVRYGAPAFLDIPTWATSGIFRGCPSQLDTLGVIYLLTTIDTADNSESEGGAHCAVWVDADSIKGGTKKPSAILLSIPSAPGGGVVRNLYRANIIERASRFGGRCGSAWYNELDKGYWFWGQTGLDSVIAKYGNPSEIYYYADAAYKYRWEIDTILVDEFRFIAQIAADVDTVTDVATYDSLLNQIVYRQGTPPIMSGVFSHDNYLWGWDGSLIYYSDLDSASEWGRFQRIAVNPDDGDQITLCFATRAGIRVFKNYSNYTVYDQYSKYEKTGDWGCIAPRSYAAAENGHFYLSARGVIFETEGQQLERTVVGGLVSQKLRNFDVMSLETKSVAVGKWLPTEGKYLLAIGDTTYVFDKRASDLLGEEVWSTWTGLTFTSGCLYNTDTSLNFLPGNDFYFVNGGNVLYKYGDTEYDPHSTKIAVNWRNEGMFADAAYKSQVVGVALRGYSAVTDSIIMGVRDETGAVVSETIYIDSLTQRYRAYHMAPSTALEYGIQLLCSSPMTHYFSGYIERIDVFVEPRIETVNWR